MIGAISASINSDAKNRFLMMCIRFSLLTIYCFFSKVPRHELLAVRRTKHTLRTSVHGQGRVYLHKVKGKGSLC
jgi:hypothetical protein